MGKAASGKYKVNSGRSSFRPSRLVHELSGITRQPAEKTRILNTIALRVSLLQTAVENHVMVLRMIREDLEKIGGAKWLEQWKKIWRDHEALGKRL